jgi:hypothetical protein
MIYKSLKGDLMIIRRFKSGLTLVAEETEIRTITRPRNLHAMDRVFCTNGDQYLVTRASLDKVELMLVSRRNLSGPEINAFLSKVSRIERPDCFAVEETSGYEKIRKKKLVRESRAWERK